MINIFAAGTPRPKGSKRMVRTTGGRTLMLEESKREPAWRDTVSAAAVTAMAHRDRLVDAPLFVWMAFGFQRPKSHYTKKGLRPGAPRFHTGKPDGSKLARSVEDALNGIVWDDDSRIALLIVAKIYVELDTPTGLALEVSTDLRSIWQPESVVQFYRLMAGAPPDGLAAFAAEAHPSFDLSDVEAEPCG